MDMKPLRSFLVCITLTLTIAAISGKVPRQAPNHEGSEHGPHDNLQLSLNQDSKGINEQQPQPDGLLLEARRSSQNKRKENPKKMKNVKDPDKYLEKFGYLPEAKQDVQHSPKARKEAIKNFQRMAGMKVTGKLDKKTLEKMGSPRCGMPDMVPDGTDMPEGAARSPAQISSPVARFYVPGYKWSKTGLTWKVQNYSPDFAHGNQRRAFYKAFKYWSDVTPLTFRESAQKDVDIAIKFAAYDHGDGYGNRFDGQGGTLAHAFYPETGDTHFDESEDWTEYTEKGTNLEIVATHEFGHALGLGHSNVPTALMAPFYQGYDASFKLHDDDIRGMQSLYGANMRPSNTPRPTRPPVRTTTPRRTRPTPRPPARPTRPTPRPPVRPTKKPSVPNVCRGKFDDMYQDRNGVIYAFYGKWVWKLNYWAVEDGYPKIFKDEFRNNPPSYMRAAVHSWKTRYTYYFKKNRIYQFYGDRRVKTKTVTTRGYPLPQAAFMARDSKIYILSGTSYWIFNENRLDVIPGSQGRITDKWPGAPTGITAAVRLSDGYIYFFKGYKYRKYNEARRYVENGYPKKTTPPWIGPKCNSGRYTPK